MTSEKKPTESRMGLVLAGGGITGAMYEIGVVAALEDGIEDFRAADFDVFVGVSSGATVAAVLAGGIPAQRMYRALLDPADPFFPLERHHLLGFAGGEWMRTATTTVSALRRLVSTYTSRPLEADLWNELDRFWDSLPAGISSLTSYEKFLSEFFARRGISERIAELPRRLAIVASDLDNGRRAVFGQGPLADVPLSKAIAASSAVPILYAPVRIADRDYIEPGLGDIGHADVALGMGCDLVIFVHAGVPIDSDPAEHDIPTGHGLQRRVRDKGLLWVYDQAMRMRATSRLRDGFARLRASRPDVAVSMIEPDSADATMFMYSPMNFAARRQILEHAYKMTRNRLDDPGSSLRIALERRGLKMRA